MGRWRSWLSHLSNTQKVLSSILGRLTFSAMLSLPVHGFASELLVSIQPLRLIFFIPDRNSCSLNRTHNYETHHEQCRLLRNHYSLQSFERLCRPEPLFSLKLRSPQHYAWKQRLQKLGKVSRFWNQAIPTTIEDAEGRKGRMGKVRGNKRDIMGIDAR